MKVYLYITLIILFSATILAGECKTRNELNLDKLDIRYDFFYQNAEVMRTKMDAIIDFLSLTKDDEVISELTEIRDRFAANYDNAKDAADQGNNAAFNGAVKESGKIIKEFRDAAKPHIENEELILGIIAQSLKENEETQEELRMATLEKQLQHRLDIYEQSLCIINEYIDQHEIFDEDVDQMILELEEKYDEFEDVMATSKEACEIRRLIVCNMTESQEGIDLLLEIKDDLRELRQAAVSAMRAGRQQQRQEKWVNRSMSLYEKGLDTAENLITKAEEKGLDVEGMNAAMEEASENYDLATEAYSQGDIENAKMYFNLSIEKLKDVKQIRIQERAVVKFNITRQGNLSEKIKKIRDVKIDTTAIRKRIQVNGTRVNVSAVRNRIYETLNTTNVSAIRERIQNRVNITNASAVRERIQNRVNITNASAVRARIQTRVNATTAVNNKLQNTAGSLR